MAEKWMQHIKKSGELREYFGLKPEGDGTIPEARLNALIDRLKGKEDLSARELKLLRQAVAARNMRRANK